MDQLVDVSIPRTHTQKKKGIFHNLYTVIFSQVYEVKVILDDSYEYFLLKRYKEFRKLHDDIKGTLGENYIFPKFPGRTMNSMNPAVISKRKSGLEKWLHAALSFKEVEEYVKAFLQINFEAIEPVNSAQKLNEDEKMIKDFSGNINSNSHSRMGLLDTFEKKYFSKRRIVRDKQVELLLNTLLPLCGDDYTGSKSLHVLYKFCTSDHNRDFELVTKELTKIPISMLRQMKLDEYLLKKRFCDSQIQAFHILNILKATFDSSAIIEIVKFIQLNNDAEAHDVYLKWDSQGLITKRPTETISSSSDWRIISLGDIDDDFQITFRFINKQLQFHAIFTLESDFSTIVDLLTQPESRKKWDLKLVDIEKIPLHNDDLGLKMLYMQDRTLYEFHNTVNVTRSIFHTIVNFRSKGHSHIKSKGILGKMTSSYKLENLSQPDCSFIYPFKEKDMKRNSSSGDILQEELEKKLASIKMTWKATFCELSKKMFVSDCLEETDSLKHTMNRFIHLAESRPSQKVEKSPANTILEACERKKLRKLHTLRKISSQDEFN